MYRMLIFARKLPHLTREQFIEAYEGNHVKLVDELVRDGVHAPMPVYRRFYLLPEHPSSNPRGEFEYDVVVESAFETMEEFQQTMARISQDPELQKTVMDDFDQFLDRSSLRYIAVEAREAGGRG